MASDFMEECRELAYRARQIHEWLDRVLRDGLVAERAYAFKGRLKTPQKIAEGVLGNRDHGDPSYSLSDVTDATGFRIVKLFNAEVPEALDQLLSLLETLPQASQARVG